MLSNLNRSLAENSCNIEHVIVVDGNDLEALPAELAANATVIASARPIGQAAARNLGLLVARGEWITSADDDDWLYPHSIDKRLAAINGQAGALWAASYCTDDLKTIPLLWPLDYAWRVMSGEPGHPPMTAFPWGQPPCLYRLPC